MITYRWLEEELKNWTFLPRSEFRVYPELRYPDLVVCLQVVVEDTHNRGMMSPAIHTMPVHYGMTKEAFPDFMRRLVHQFMVHEADEWLARKGQVLFDPHAKR